MINGVKISHEAISFYKSVNKYKTSSNGAASMVLYYVIVHLIYCLSVCTLDESIFKNIYRF